MRSSGFPMSRSRVLAPYFQRSRGKALSIDRRVVQWDPRASSAMACAGAMPQRSTGRTRRSTTGMSAGPATACSPASSRHWRRRPTHQGASSSTARTCKAHRTAAQPVAETRGPRQIGRTKGGPNSTLHAVCDRHARPLVLLLSPGQMRDHQGRRTADRRAAACLRADRRPRLTTATVVVAALEDPAASRPASHHAGTAGTPSQHDPALYRQRHPIENLFAKLKDWRRIATRYDRCADIFMGPSPSPQPSSSGLRQT